MSIIQDVMGRSKRGRRQIINIHLRGMRSQEEVWAELDHQLHPYLQSKGSRTFYIVVGRGLNSNRLIDGVNPVRAWAQSYLRQLDLSGYQPPDHEGGDGIICVDL